MNEICYVRFLNASANSPAFDIYVNDKLFASALSYKNFTEYFKGNMGEYNIKIYKAGDKKNIILQENVELFMNNIYTIAIIDISNGLTLNLIGDHLRNLDKNYAYIRFINLSPSLQNLDIVINNVLVISDLEYGVESNYLKILPGTYNFKAISYGELVLENPRLVLDAGKIYSGYIVGNEGDIKILLPLEGATYLKF